MSLVVCGCRIFSPLTLPSRSEGSVRGEKMLGCGSEGDPAAEAVVRRTASDAGCRGVPCASCNEKQTTELDNRPHRSSYLSPAMSEIQADTILPPGMLNLSSEKQPWQDSGDAVAHSKQ